MISSYELALQEPPLREVMHDPIIRSLMRHDAVQEEDILRLADFVAAQEA